MSLIQDLVAEMNEEALFADGLDDALVGFTRNTCEPCRAVYDADKCIEILVKDNEGMTDEEAEEYLEFNTFGAYVGKHGPVFISMRKGSE